MNSKGFTLVGVLIVVVVIFTLFFGLGRGLFVDSSVAKRALETQGYADVQIMSEHWFAVAFQGCSEQDAAKYVARAKNPRGQEVEVFVCIGWPFKGATVRTY